MSEADDMSDDDEDEKGMLRQSLKVTMRTARARRSTRTRRCSSARMVKMKKCEV